MVSVWAIREDVRLLSFLDCLTTHWPPFKRLEKNMESTLQTKSENKQKVSTTDIPNQLSNYFEGIEQNVNGDPFAIAHAYILGTFLQCNDSQLSAIVKEHLDRCGQICNTGELFRCMSNNGDKELEAIPLVMASNSL